MAPCKEMILSNPVLVVGTTPDYVVRINDSCRPGSVVFLMRDRFLSDPLLATIPVDRLIFAPFQDVNTVLNSTAQFFSSQHMSPGGVACFDCDSLISAGRLAAFFGKPFPPPEAVIRSRNKLLVKQIWMKAGVPTPAGIIARGWREAATFFADHPDGIVLKPISGGGSELVFFCSSKKEVEESTAILEEELPRRVSNPLFKVDQDTASQDPIAETLSGWVAEAYISGPEFSCDFFLEHNSVKIIRITGKVKAPDQTFGSVLAYMFPAVLPDKIAMETLSKALYKASTALGFDWGHFMVDFIINNNEVFIIELSPRPGGDSIPDLVETATGRDLLSLHIDFVSGRQPALPLTVAGGRSYASINIFAAEEGIIKAIDTSKLHEYPGVKKVILKRKAGDTITLPPADYDSRFIGNCIIETNPNTDMSAEYYAIRGMVHLSLSKKSNPMIS